MTTEKDVGLIYQAIPAIMAELPSIYKDRKNSVQNYSFRGIDDVYNAVNPVMAKYGVFMRAEMISEPKREERPSKSGGTMAFVQVHVRYYFVAKDGSSVYTDSLGEGMDSGDKATPKAMSIAQKYAILQMFCIPTADPKDIEDDNPEPKPAPAVVHAPKRNRDEFDPEGSPDPLDEAHHDEPEIDTFPGGCTLKDLNSMAKAIADLKMLGVDEGLIFGGINKQLRNAGLNEIAEPSELTHENAERVLGYLHRWRGAVERDKAKAATS